MTIVTALACTLLLQAAPAAPISREPVDTAYLVDTITTVRASAEPTARVVATVKPIDVLMLYEAKPGWLLVSVGQGEGKEPLYGWVKGPADNLLHDTFFNSIRRLVTIQRQGWPLSVQADILRQRPRIGFTKAQVAAALEEPISKTSEETAAGTTEVWVYPAHVITFKAGKVVTVRKVE